MNKLNGPTWKWLAGGGVAVIGLLIAVIFGIVHTGVKAAAQTAEENKLELAARASVLDGAVEQGKDNAKAINRVEKSVIRIEGSVAANRRILESIAETVKADGSGKP